MRDKAHQSHAKPFGLGLYLAQRGYNSFMAHELVAPKLAISWVAIEPEIRSTLGASRAHPVLLLEQI